MLRFEQPAGRHHEPRLPRFAVSRAGAGTVIRMALQAEKLRKHCRLR